MWDTIIVDPMINALLYIYSFLGENFGLAIIVFTILVRILIYPLTAKQLKSAREMQEMQKSKKWQDIQKKYKDDREKLSQEQMKLYKEMGISPFGSCLPTLIQFPIIIGLYQAIINALAATPIQLLDLSSHIYSFLPNLSAVIPINSRFLWMDLGMAERLYLPFLSDIFPFLPENFGIPVLAIIVTATSFLQTRMTTPPTSSSSSDQGASMTKAMSLYMPLLMGWLALSFASGLALYFTASNIVGILQSLLMNRLRASMEA